MTIKRSQFATFLNTSATPTPAYNLIGDGVTSGSIDYNPQTEDEIYIHQDSGSTEVTGYKPVFPVEAKCKDGDPVFEFVDALRKARAVLDEAHTDAVLVYLYETPVSGEYPAEKQLCSIQIDSFGGDGGATNVIKYQINFMGDAIPGTFDPETKTFTPD